MNIPNYSEALFRGNLNEAFRVKREAIPTKIYKFIPLGISEEADRNKLSTLENDELWFSPISSFNDPYEYLGLHIDNEKLNRAGYGDELISAVHEVLKAIGGQGLVCCFSAADYRAAPMWAYYANWSKGFCVEYDVVDPRPLREVLYEPKPCDVTSIVANLLKDALDKNPGDSFDAQSAITMELLSANTCIKHESWKHEQEFRIVIPVESNRGCSLPVSSSGLKTCRIILGIQCNCRQKIEAIGRSLNIEVSKLIKSEKSFFSEEVSENIVE